MIIIRVGEIFTKSPPVQREFFRQLLHNIRCALPQAEVWKEGWRVVVQARTKKEEKQAAGVLQRVFGIVSISVVEDCAASLPAIKKLVSKVAVKGTFAIRAKRLDKAFLLTSQQINEKIGGFVCKKTGARVDLENPDTEIGIEINRGHAFVFTQTLAGPGGLPLGTAGCMRADKRTKNGKMAAWLLMKRGADVGPLEGWDYGTNFRNPTGMISGETDPEKFAALAKRLARQKKFVLAPLIGLSPEQLRGLEVRIGGLKKRILIN